MAVMPAEVRATVQLYVNGKIREWFSRADGRGAVFLLDAKDDHEAETIMDALPLAKQNLMDHEYMLLVRFGCSSRPLDDERQPQGARRTRQ
jgi:hypothetical protein